MQNKQKKSINFSFEKAFGKFLAFLPKFTKSFYFIIAILFLIWMFFFDSNDFITQYQRLEHLKNLEEEKVFYKQEIKNIEQKNQRILNNNATLERFGRENYFLKKSKEDLYIIAKKPKKQQIITSEKSDNKDK